MVTYEKLLWAAEYSKNRNTIVLKWRNQHGFKHIFVKNVQVSMYVSIEEICLKFLNTLASVYLGLTNWSKRKCVLSTVYFVRLTSGTTAPTDLAKCGWIVWTNTYHLMINGMIAEYAWYHRKFSFDRVNYHLSAGFIEDLVINGNDKIMVYCSPSSYYYNTVYCFKNVLSLDYADYL